MKERKNDLLILGAGDAGRVSADPKVAFSRVDEVRRSYNEVLENCRLLTTRTDSLFLLLPDLAACQILPCPATFAPTGVDPIPHDLTCNLMPNGGHYTDLEPELVKLCKAALPILGRFLLEEGAFFCAHNDQEAGAAFELGWRPSENLAVGKNILPHYVGTKTYFGNRVHGGVVVSASGGKASVVGYDLRLRAAEIAGCGVHYLNTKNPFPKPLLVENPFQQYLDLIKGVL